MNESEEVPIPPGKRDWKWQLKNSVKDVKGLEKYISLTASEKDELQKCLENFKMSITPYYISLMDTGRKSCPIRLQAVPSFSELITRPEEDADPLGEEAQSPVKGLIHRYPDRVLMLVTYKCAMYCRHCTRRRVVGCGDAELSYDDISACVRYIRSNENISDVIISGGDPLTLPVKKLEYILRSVRAVKHVGIIRIGTRVPVVLPMRINDELVSMLRRYHPIYINTHFNHPVELSADACGALSMLADAGIPLGNQTVLLRGVNNDPEILKDLFLKLLRNRVKPYYLYQCDLAKGISHFRTTVDEGLAIMKKLQGNISGMAIPKYVIDAPSGGGKIPILPDYYSINGDKVILKNYLDKEYVYPNIAGG